MFYFFFVFVFGFEKQNSQTAEIGGCVDNYYKHISDYMTKVFFVVVKIIDRNKGILVRTEGM